MDSNTPPEVIDLADEVNEDDNGQEANTSSNSGESGGSPASGQNPGGDGGEVGGDVAEVGGEGGEAGGDGGPHGGAGEGAKESKGSNSGNISKRPTRGDACPQVTEILRKHLKDFGKSLEKEVTERYSNEIRNLKDSHKSDQKYVRGLEKKVRDQSSKLQDYQRQLQQERSSNERKFSELEITANNKELLLTRQLESLEKTLETSKKEYSDYISLKESDIQAIRKERDLMENAKKAAENELKKETVKRRALQVEVNILEVKVSDLSKELETEKDSREKLEIDCKQLEVNRAIAAKHVEILSAVLTTPKETCHLRLKSGSLVISDRPDSGDGMIPGPSSPPAAAQKRKLLQGSAAKDKNAGSSSAKIRRNAHSSSEGHFREARMTTGQNERTIPRSQSEIRANGGVGTRGSSRRGEGGNMGNVTAGAATSTHPNLGNCNPC